MRKKIKIYIRKDDGERFTPNEDGTYSSQYMKEHYPGHLYFKYNEASFLNGYFREEWI